VLKSALMNTEEESEPAKENSQAPPLPEGRGLGGGVTTLEPVAGKDVHTYGMYTTDAKRWKKTLKDYARANRKEATPAENHLWQELRSNKLGASFRRQHAITQFIVDFVCLAAWLIIEVDGEVHADPSEAEYDGGRTHELQECGFLVIRFTNNEVLYDTPRVLKSVSEHLTLLHPNYPKH
jgi:very-short-patch-repair endonuclease